MLEKQSSAQHLLSSASVLQSLLFFSSKSKSSPFKTLDITSILSSCFHSMSLGNVWSLLTENLLAMGFPISSVCEALINALRHSK